MRNNILTQSINKSKDIESDNDDENLSEGEEEKVISTQ